MNVEKQRLVFDCLIQGIQNSMPNNMTLLENLPEFINKFSCEFDNEKSNINSTRRIVDAAKALTSFIDRSRDDAETEHKGILYESVFNKINGSNHNKVHAPSIIDVENKINYPTDICADDCGQVIKQSVDNISDALKYYKDNLNYINYFLSVLENNLSYVPAYADKNCRDIAVFDKVKLTAAISGCIYDYIHSNNGSVSEDILNESDKLKNEKFILLYSLDISGIQSFIYTVSSSGALKGLRARSFYLDMFLEISIDSLLERLELSRTNVIYSGGGHAYIFLPSNDFVRKEIETFEAEINTWLLKKFKDKLYLAGGYVECNAKQLSDKPKGSYSDLFKTISGIIYMKKMSRYDANQLLFLNSKNKNLGRECQMCKLSDNLIQNPDGQYLCETCDSLNKISTQLFDSEAIFCICNSKPKTDAYIEFPFGKYMTVKNHTEGTCFSKNRTEKNSYTVRLGDYSFAKTLGELSEKSTGIKKLAVLRADIDNLGQAFVGGFDGNDVSISRTAAFSRLMSLFFKYHINEICENGKYQLFTQEDKTGKRNVSIVYSGGDDLFIVGAWDDIIALSVDIHNEFEKFCCGTLTISAGIGIYDTKDPISTMAKETGNLESNSKNNPGKNSISLFEKRDCYNWDDFINKVLNEKYITVRDFFTLNRQYGTSFLYHMLELIHGVEESNKLNIAKFAYVLARMKPDNENATDKQKDRYKKFSSTLYNWIQNAEDRRQLTTAIYIYAYAVRNTEID